MAKKKRKKRSTASRRQQSQLARSRKAPIASAKKRKTAQVSFAEEYRYVFSDLKRMGILATGMFALMVVLAYIMR